MMHSPLFQIFPSIFDKFSDCGKLPFPETFFDFHPPKFLMTFFSHRPQISNFLLFALLKYILPCFAKITISPYFEKCPLVFEKFTCFLQTLCVFRFPPYFDHDEFMHKPMHVGLLDTSDRYCSAATFG